MYSGLSLGEHSGAVTGSGKPCRANALASDQALLALGYFPCLQVAFDDCLGKGVAFTKIASLLIG